MVRRLREKVRGTREKKEKRRENGSFRFFVTAADVGGAVGIGQADLLQLCFRCGRHSCAAPKTCNYELASLAWPSRGAMFRPAASQAQPSCDADGLQDSSAFHRYVNLV